MTKQLPSLKNPNGGHPPAFVDVQVLELGVLEYFNQCEVNKREPSHVGLAQYLGVPKRTLNEYTRKPGYSSVLEMAKERIEDILCSKLSDKGYATAGIIFNLTNNYGWKQPNQIEHSGAIAVAHSQVPMDVQIELDAHRAEIEDARPDENPS
jgi:hypothetical protein